MAPQGYLFVNKHSNSPSLSRNTGNEASLASKVNKHVQQQRFWKSSGPRKNWYRPFVRSDSSGPTTPSEASFHEEVTDFKSERSSSEQEHRVSLTRRSTEQSRQTSPRRPTASSRRSASTRLPPRSVPENLVRRHTVPNTIHEREKQENEPIPIHVTPRTSLSSRPGDINDPFNNTVIQVTPELRDVLDLHLRWAVSSSVSDFAIKEGIQRIFESVLTDRMHSAAFLAMATAQQRKTNNIVLPHNNSPEFYSYCATKIIREYIESHTGEVEPYTFVDIFRLGMCEWISGNYTAARIHFSYIAKNYNDFKPHNAGEWHNIEVISTEDLFLAMDVDKKPLLLLNWEPELPAGPHLALPESESQCRIRSSIGSIQPSVVSTTKTELSNHALLSSLPANSPLKPTIHALLTSLKSFPQYTKIDFGSATTGAHWTMKRRIHATLHRLQSMDADAAQPGIEACIRRTLLILLFLASTTPARRLGRTDVPQLAGRLKDAFAKVKAAGGAGPCEPSTTPVAMHPRLLLWMFITGLAAAREGQGPVDQELLHWFRKRAVILAVQVCGASPTSDMVEGVLAEYLTFANVHGDVVGDLCRGIRLQIAGKQPGWPGVSGDGGFRIVDGPL